MSRLKWVPVPPELARRHPLYGFGGWHWLLLLYFLLDAAGTVFSANLMGVGGIGWAVAAFHVALAALLAFSLAIFRPLLFAYAALSLIATLVGRIPTFAKMASVPIGMGMPLSLFIMVAVVIYVNESRRINVTMCRRVTPDDPILHEVAS
ncbi:MAG: hypothetical protein NVV74_02445 [Magnetospirillum sp.]|nr:hypothetical protein [Magnetospirillum sp.]